MPQRRFLRIFAAATLLAAAGCGTHRSALAGSTPDATHGADMQRGKAVYAAQCQACHGASGEGGIGPKLQHERERRSFEKVRSIVLDPDPPMPKLYPAELTANDVRDVSAYVESL